MIKKSNVAQVPQNQIQISKDSLISCVQNQKKQERSGSSSGIRIIRQSSDNATSGAYSVDPSGVSSALNKPQFFNQSNAIPTSIKTSNKSGTGTKVIKIKTPT